MIISKKGLDLIRQEEPDLQIQEILNDPSILEKLSESHSYPSPMPTKICFRIEKEGATDRSDLS